MGGSFSVTQAGISAAVHVQRKHVPRTLKRLEKREEVYSGQRHVPGAKQRRKVYGLTIRGKERAGSLRNKILSEFVIKSGEKVQLQTSEKVVKLHSICYLTLMKAYIPRDSCYFTGFKS